MQVAGEFLRKFVIREYSPRIPRPAAKKEWYIFIPLLYASHLPVTGDPKETELWRRHGHFQQCLISGVAKIPAVHKVFRQTVTIPFLPSFDLPSACIHSDLMSTDDEGREKQPFSLLPSFSLSPRFLGWCAVSEELLRERKGGGSETVGAEGPYQRERDPQEGHSAS